ncbi:MAG: GTP-binding protein [Candidatus Heimdallarchaeota archaeon]|nr:GTP-binding protein [Candidatus Heimdallarchaeota archaeon]MDH5644546.1 GTP-binding protein [Candidatus Heimdallarchaeota archaeon]
MSKGRASFKVVLLGDARVGKTSIRRNYLGESFKENYMVTLGADFAIKRLGTDVIQIWDLAGQPVYKAVRSGYYKGAQGAIFTFDITRPDTFSNVPKWIDEMVGVSERLVPSILVGNKADLRDSTSNPVSVEDASNYAKQLTDWSGFKVPYIESSALTGYNIDDIFASLIREIEILNESQQGQ